MEEFGFGPWKLFSNKGHIMKSNGEMRKLYESTIKLPQLPEMIFPDNFLRITHESGFGIEFSALDALKLVDNKKDPVKVATTVAWRNARSDCEFIDKVVEPFDWTYTTTYQGTLIGPLESRAQEEATTDRINIEKLKVQEKIHFYADLVLYEDELADNGCSLLNVKVRVMPSSFFILLRFYLRVDGVLVRIYDTRFYHEIGWSYIIREFVKREKNLSELNLEPSILTNPVEVSQHLPVVEEQISKLIFPPLKTNNELPT